MVYDLKFKLEVDTPKKMFSFNNDKIDSSSLKKGNDIYTSVLVDMKSGLVIVITASNEGLTHKFESNKKLSISYKDDLPVISLE